MENLTSSLQLDILNKEESLKWEYPKMYIIKTDFYSEEEIHLLTNALPLEELNRSNRFRFKRDRNSYIITHAILRLRLGEFFHELPERIRMDHNSFGKPFLSDHTDLHFSLSHSHGITVIGFDSKYEIGVDVEEMNPHFDYIPVTDRFYSENEIRQIQASEDKRTTFYTIWTRKEAYLKSLGIGIGEQNLEVDVSAEYPLPPEHFALNTGSTRYVVKTMTFRDRFIISVSVPFDSGKVEAYLPGGIFMLNI